MIELKYPESMGFDKAIEIGRKIIERYGGTIQAKALAEEMDLKEETTYSGAFYRKLDALRQFRILEPKTTNGRYITTELMKKAGDLYDKSGAAHAKAAMWDGILLIKELHKEFQGASPNKDEFSARLYKITGANWSDIKKKSNTVRKLYMESLKYIKLAKEPEKPPVGEGLGRGEIMVEPEAGVQALGEVRTVDGTIRVVDARTLKMARDLLNLLEKRTKERKKEVKPQEEK